MAFVRGQFCELAARLRALDSTEQYLLGLLSLLPAMLRIPMEELTPGLPLRDGISQALQGTANSDRCALAWLECHERGDWTASDGIATQYGLNVDQMICDYAKAVAWAEEAVSAIH
jgi:EAL and modified HD-GYP domain-containing signal transduction protein